MKLSKQKYDFSKMKLVCVLTGAGLKDPDTAIKYATPPTELPAHYDTVEREILRNQALGLSGRLKL